MATNATKKSPLVCHGHSRPIVEIQFSTLTPDGVFLISASKDGKPMLRNGMNGDWIGTFEGHKGAVWSAVLNKPAWVAATASADFTAKIWDAASGDELYSFQHKHIVRCCAFAEDSNRLATGGMEKLVRIFDIEQPSSDPIELPLLPASVRCLQWAHKDDLLLASMGDKPGVMVFDLRSGQIAQTLTTAAPVTSIEVSEDGAFLTTSDGKTARVWDNRALSPVHTVTAPCEVESASYNPDKSLLALGGADLWVHTYHVPTGEELEVFKGHHGPVHAVRFCPGGGPLASGSEDGTIRLWTPAPKSEQ